MKDQQVDILAIGVHPDDVELSCAGTILNQVAKGHSVAIVDMTKGELGTRGSATKRMEEATAAAQILGVSQRINLGMKDGFFETSETNTRKLITAIRRFRPKIVLANAPRDRHPDHGRASKLIADACYYAGLSKIETSFQQEEQEKWRPQAVYHYIQDYTLKADLIVDVSGFVDQKFKSIFAYDSQFFQEKAEGPQTPISSKAFMDILKGRMQMWGRLIGVEYGEGFIVNRPPGIDDITKLL